MTTKILDIQTLPESLLALTKPANTLFSFLSKYRVIVPGIQRHYVQGADSVKAREVRKEFIKDIFKAMPPDDHPMDLNFIYGPIDTSGTDAFIPVDGQQRLTTLWLLARYFTEFLEKAARNAIIPLLGKFSYEERIHAKRFCKAFTSPENDFYNPDNNESNWKPSDAIRHSQWFNPYWVTDQTVSGMLNTLDTIHEVKTLHENELATESKLPEPKDYLDNMGRLLTFQLCIEEFADDVYMKMNARGLSLTQWENFKGKFAGLINNQEEKKTWERNIEKLSDAYFIKTKTLSEKTEVQSKESEGQLPDNAFFAYMARIIVYEAEAVIKDKTKNENNSTVNISQLAKQTNFTSELPYVPFSEFEYLLKSLPQKVDNISSVFLKTVEYTTTGEVTGEIANLPTPYWQGENKLLQSIFKPKNKNELDFSLCIYEYFKKFTSPQKEEFTLALRLMWNILGNTPPGGDKTPYSRIKNIQEIIALNCPSLYSIQIDQNRQSIQHAEEATKAAVYARNNNDEIALMQTVEEYLHGRIRLGILDLNDNNKAAFAPERLSVLKQLFEHYDPSNKANNNNGKKLEDTRKHIIRMVVAGESVDPKNEIPISAASENLQNLLTTEDDKYLQEGLLDFLKTCDYQNLTEISPEEVLENNPSTFGETNTLWWKRDLRKTTLLLTAQENTKTENLWETYKIKWHNTDHYYLFKGTNIPNALPINDYRIELFYFDFYNTLEKDIHGIQSIKMNDGHTHSLRYKETDWRIYFYPHLIEIRKWDETTKRFIETKQIPSDGTGMSCKELLGNLQQTLQNKTQVE